MLDKLPLFAIVAAVLVTVVYIFATGEFLLTGNVAGVFLITALLAAGVLWVIKRRLPKKEP